MVSIDRRVVLIGGAVVLGAVAAGGVLALRHRGIAREPNLVGDWAFEEGAGSSILDSSGLGNDGVIEPQGVAAGTWGTGPFAGSLAFSGRDDNHVRIRPTDALNRIRKELTVAAYVYPRSGWQKGGPGDGFVAVVQRQWRTVLHPDLFYLGFGVENDIQQYKWHVGLVGSEQSLYRLPPGVAAVRVNDWVHLAGTYDGAGGAMVLYVDGAEIGRLSAPGEIRLDQGSFERPLVIGAELNGESLDDASGEFDGYIDEVRLYDRALSGDEVKALAAAARERRGKSAPA